MFIMRVTAFAAVLCLGAWGFAFAQPTAARPSGEALQGAAPGSDTSSEMTATEQEARNRLESQGYTDVRDVKSTAEGISAKAMKEGRPVSISIDSSGKVREK